MNTPWAKSQAVVWAIGGHVLLLALLFHAWQHKPPPKADSNRRTSASTLIDATLVTGIPSPSGKADPAIQPPVLLPTPPTELASSSRRIADSRRPTVVQPPESPPVEHPEVHEPDDVTENSPLSQPVALPPPLNDAPGSAAAAQQTDSPDDPYAEMRRLRAEAEQRYQAQQLGDRTQEPRQALLVSSGKNDAIGSSMQHPIVENVDPPWPFAPQPQVLPFLFGTPGFAGPTGMPVWTCRAYASGSTVNGAYVFDRVECGPDPETQGPDRDSVGP